MNNKFINDAMDDEFEKALMDGTYSHKFTLQATPDLSAFEVISSGIPSCHPHAELFALVNIIDYVLSRYSKEYDVQYKDAVEHMITHLSDIRKIKGE